MSKFQDIVKGRETWYAAVHGVAKSQTGLNNNMINMLWALMDKQTTYKSK